MGRTRMNFNSPCKHRPLPTATRLKVYSLASLFYQQSRSTSYSMSSLSRRDAEKQVADWGFGHVFTWTDGANAYYPPHSHAGLTTHLILKGQLTISYPDDDKPGKETFGVGARVDVDAKRRHEVWMGNQGCIFNFAEDV